MWGKGSDIFRCGIFSFSSTVCWKTFLSLLKISWLTINIWVYFYCSVPISLYVCPMAIPHWLHYCSFIASFEVRLCNPSNFVLFQISFEKNIISLIFFFFFPNQRKFIFPPFRRSIRVYIYLCIYSSNKKVKMKCRTLCQSDLWGPFYYPV